MHINIEQRQAAERRTSTKERSFKFRGNFLADLTETYERITIQTGGILRLAGVYAERPRKNQGNRTDYRRKGADVR